MCHGFLSVGDSGERISHAVGCAFAICLEKKQQREKVSALTNSYQTYCVQDIELVLLQAT